ncbi:MAG: Uma2 family endonuclease [bacterium]
MSTKTVMTDEELMQLPDDGYKYEYVEGELKVSPTGMLHESIAVNLITKLYEFLKKHQLGRVYSSSAGYRMKSGNVRSPDVSFVRKSKLPEGKSPEGFAHFAPDLAVEILSPSDSLEELHDKVVEYFDNGCEIVWVIDPKKRTATVYQSLNNYQILHENDELTGAEVLAGFSCHLKDLLE